MPVFSKSEWREIRDQAMLGAAVGVTTGNVWYVHSSGANTNAGNSSAAPLATLDAANNKCTANRGDIVVAMPGHAETLSAASAITMDVAGVTFIGLGHERARPTLTFAGAVGASIVVSGANVKMSGFVFSGGLDALTNPISVQAANFELFNFTFVDTTGQVTDFLVTTAAASNMHLHDFVYDGATAAGTNAGIAIVGGDGIRIHDFIADGNFAVGFIDVRTTATTDLKVWGVKSFRNRNAVDIFIIDTITGSTGTIGPDLSIRIADNAANITEACTGATFVYFQPINIVNLAGESSMQTNITASTDA